MTHYANNTENNIYTDEKLAHVKVAAGCAC